MTFTEAVRQQLRAERAAAGLTINGLAAKSGVSRSSVTRYEGRGGRSPNADDLAVICAAFGLRLSEFIRRAEERMVRDGMV